MSQTYARFGAIRLAFLITLVLLVIEYVFGMISNFEVQFPGNLPAGNAWGWVWSHSLIIQFPISTGPLLLVITLVALLVSMVARNIIYASNNDNDISHCAIEVKMKGKNKHESRHRPRLH